MAPSPARDDDDLGEMHEINVTPFIDVMLVLLIIFMVAAPLATVDVKVDLPRSTAAPTVQPDKPLTLTVAADETLRVGDTVVVSGDARRRSTPPVPATPNNGCSCAPTRASNTAC